MKLYLLRDYQTEEVTLGRIFDPNSNFYLHTLELPWLDNKPNISCIPADCYTAKRDYYHKGGYAAFELRNVPSRSEIKIHIGNWTRDVLGCIVVGKARMAKGNMVTSSRTAFREFMEYTKGHEYFELEILELK